MGKRSDELQREIAEYRQRLDAKVDRLDDRVRSDLRDSRETVDQDVRQRLHLDKYADARPLLTVAVAFGTGVVHYYLIGMKDPRQAAQISRKIDSMFENSSNETRTQTESALAQMQLKQLGDINFIANAIVGAVLFTLLFLTANTMMQSVRERTSELAVLKTLGFSDEKVLTLTVGSVFASRWLIWRIAKFNRLHPEIEVRLVVTGTMIDLAHSDIDFGIRFGRGKWPGLKAELIGGARYSPVAAPPQRGELRQNQANSIPA